MIIDEIMVIQKIVHAETRLNPRNYQRRAASARFEARHYQKRNKFKFSYSRRAREISAFVARIVVLYKLKMQYHAHPSAMPMWYNVREDGCMKNYKTKSKFICKMHY